MTLERLLEVRRHAGEDKEMSLFAHIMTNTSVGEQCWEWSGAKARADYPMMRIDGKAFGVHRLIANLAYSLDLTRTDLVVCHKCDNAKCINPKHLFVGTQSDNLADMVRKGRQKQKRAPNEKDLLVIQLADAGKSVSAISRQVGYCRSYVRLIANSYKKHWIQTGQLCPQTKDV